MKQKKKILILSDYFYPHWTGISKSLYYLLQGLEGIYDITVLTVALSTTVPKEEVLFGAKIIREPFLFSLSRAKYSIRILIRAVSLISTTDIVFINSPCSNILPLSILTKIFRKKLIIFHQGDLLLPEGFLNRVIEKLFDISSLSAAKLADKLATYTIDYAKFSRILYPFLYKVSAVLFPIFLPKPNISCNKIEALAKFIKEKKIIFGFAGRFVEEKGFDILLDAIPAIIKEVPNAHFVFAGETNMKYENFFDKNKNKLSFVEPYLTMVGLLDDACLAFFYLHLDFLIVPSRSDCFNLVQAEAMLSGVPVIVSDIPGARVLVQKTGFGKIFAAGNSMSLANTVIEGVKEKKEIIKQKQNVSHFLDNALILESFKRFVES